MSARQSLGAALGQGRWESDRGRCLLLRWPHFSRQGVLTPCRREHKPGPSALPGSIPTPATQEKHSFHRAMGSNTPPGPVSSLTCLSCRTDLGKEATWGLFSAPNLDHGPHQGWDEVHRGPQRAPDFCSSPFHTWLPFFSFLQEAPPWSNFRD